MQYRKRLIVICFLTAASFQLPAQSNPIDNMDITGLWKGTLYNDTIKKFLRYEIGISEKKGKLSGYSHTFFIVDDKEYYGVKKVKIKRTGDKIIIQAEELIANNYPVPPAKGVHQLDVLSLEMQDSIMILSGPFTTNRTKEYNQLTGSIRIQRKKDFHQSALVPHLEELGLAQNLSFVQQERTLPVNPVVSTATVTTNPEPVVTKTTPEIPKPEPVAVKTIPGIPKPEPVVAKAKPVMPKPEPVVAKATPVIPKPEPVETKVKPVIPKPEPREAKATPVIPGPVTENKPDKLVVSAATDVAKRTIETIQSVYFRSDSLVLTLYDNGEVDGDTVSVLMNGVVIMPMQGLSTRAIRKTIYITKDMPDSIQLIMYAENLGSIPPNTGLLVVHDGEDVYEIRFSGDYQKNTAIMFRRKKY